VLHGIGRRHGIGDLLGLIFLRLLCELRGGGNGNVAALKRAVTGRLQR
jgi:hypothetical protein